MRLREKLVRGTILFPILFLGYIQIHPVKLYIRQLNVSLDYTVGILLYTLFTVVWLSCSSFRRVCRHGGVFELCFNLFPIELLLFVVFAQWHFVWACIILGIALLATIGISALLLADEKGEELTDAAFKQTTMACKRFFVLAACVLWLVPSLVSVIIYEMEDPKYVAEQECLEELLSAYNSENNAGKINELPEEVAALFACFQTDVWRQYSLQERITVLQELVDYEAKKLGMPTVEITAEVLGISLLGQQGGADGGISVDIHHLLDSPVEAVLNTCLHETYHAYQDFLVESIDWGERYTNSVYFQEVRSWRDNYGNYVRGNTNFEAYEAQPLEKAAREYAKKEKEYILSFLAE